MRNKLLPIVALMLVFSFVAAFSQGDGLIKTVVSVTGTVINEVTKEPVSVNIIVTDNAGKKIQTVKSNSKDGYYYVTSLRPGNTYYFKIDSKNYLNEVYTINVTNTDRYFEISRDFAVKPLEQDAMIPIQVPPFELNKSHLRFGSAFLLNDLAATLANNPKVDFKIVCYPDNAKDARRNKELTESRAQALMDYLVIQGVDPTRITISGSETVDPKNPPPAEKRAKGKRYIGTSYVVITDFK